jgi:hypothetical protein
MANHFNKQEEWQRVLCGRQKVWQMTLICWVKRWWQSNGWNIKVSDLGFIFEGSLENVGVVPLLKRWLVYIVIVFLTKTTKFHPWNVSLQVVGLDSWEKFGNFLSIKKLIISLEVGNDNWGHFLNYH